MATLLNARGNPKALRTSDGHLVVVPCGATRMLTLASPDCPILAAWVAAGEVAVDATLQVQRAEHDEPAQQAVLPEPVQADEQPRTRGRRRAG